MMARSESIPPWFRCSVCNRNRAGHDKAEAKLPPHLRHDWVTVTQHNRQVAKRVDPATQPQLADTDGHNHEGMN